jgi:transcription-repair coupling factor (superfamily II helicase)
MHDLERGTGEVLGEKPVRQHDGNRLSALQRDAARGGGVLKAGCEPDLLSPLSVTTEINLHAPALLPSDSRGDVHLRLSFTKLATTKTEQIDDLEEIVDRFGNLPPSPNADRRTACAHRQAVLCGQVDAAPASTLFKKDPPTIDGHHAPDPEKQVYQTGR